MTIKRQKGITTKNKLMKEAISLFIEKGYGNVTVDDIVEAANSSKGSFYHHFISKDALLVEFNNSIRKDYLISLENFLSDNRESSGVELLRKLFDFIIGTSIDNYDSIKTLITIAKESGIKEKYFYLDEIEAILCNILKKGILNNEIKSGIDPSNMAKYMTTTIYYNLIQIYDFDKRTYKKELNKMMVDILNMFLFGIT